MLPTRQLVQRQAGDENVGDGAPIFLSTPIMRISHSPVVWSMIFLFEQRMEARKIGQRLQSASGDKLRLIHICDGWSSNRISLGLKRGKLERYWANPHSYMRGMTP